MRYRIETTPAHPVLKRWGLPVMWWVVDPFGTNERHPHASLALAMDCAHRLAQVAAMESALRQDFGVEPKRAQS